MSTLDDVKSYMEFWGWKNGGNPGSVKLDADDKVIAIHGGATWISDVEEACQILKWIAHRAAAR